MSTILYKDDNHQCLVFSDLVQGSGIQANQFLIINNGEAALLDPGGPLTYHPLLSAIMRHTSMDDLKYILASHQDPDIISSMGMWLSFSKATIVASALWSRFLPHLVTTKMTEGNRDTDLASRLVGVPDEGAKITLGNSYIKLVPAHFLHSVGNFQFYDPVSKILFSGDMGASLVKEDPGKPVENFAEHVQTMQVFHMRYMGSNKICRLWANMVRQMDVEMIVPQHGRPFQGKEMVKQFLDWIEKLQCGMDLMTEDNYRP